MNPSQPQRTPWNRQSHITFDVSKNLRANLHFQAFFLPQEGALIAKAAAKARDGHT
jgi:hypothetical protein